MDSVDFDALDDIQGNFGMTVLNVFSSNQDSTSDVGNSTRERPYSSHNENLSTMCKDFCAIPWSRPPVCGRAFLLVKASRDSRS
jgi:hypothetical protein